jgi:GDP-mannose 6-dehydrogenase
VLDLDAERIGIFGLAFKENTDELRESPVVELIEYLLGKGRNIRIFDPHIQLEQIYGSNRNFLLSAIPHISKWLAGSWEELLGWAEHVVLAQKPSSAISEQIAQRAVPVLDLVGVLSDTRTREPVRL